MDRASAVWGYDREVILSEERPFGSSHVLIRWHVRGVGNFVCKKVKELDMLRNLSIRKFWKVDVSKLCLCVVMVSVEYDEDYIKENRGNLIHG